MIGEVTGIGADAKPVCKSFVPSLCARPVCKTCMKSLKLQVHAYCVQYMQYAGHASARSHVSNAMVHAFINTQRALALSVLQHFTLLSAGQVWQ